MRQHCVGHHLDGYPLNDVGQNTWEEVNPGVSGANYGELFRVQSASTSAVVFQDDFENDRGWTLTGGANYATRDLWQRGDPEPTRNARPTMLLVVAVV